MSAHDSCSGAASETINNNNDGVYNRLIKVVDYAISTMCQGLASNPYQEHGAAMLIYIVARICVEIANTAARPNRLTASLVIVPSLIAIEAALWIIAAGQLSWFIIINVTILLVALICYYEEHICKLLNKCYGKIFGQQGFNTTLLIAQEGFMLVLYSRKILAPALWSNVFLFSAGALLENTQPQR